MQSLQTTPAHSASDAAHRLLAPYALLYADKQLLKHGEYRALLERIKRRRRWGLVSDAAFAFLVLGMIVYGIHTQVEFYEALPETPVTARPFISTVLFHLMLLAPVAAGLYWTGKASAAIEAAEVVLSAEAVEA